MPPNVPYAHEEGFEVRIARYNGGLFWIFRQRVVSLVVLADLDKQWRPSEDVFQLGDFSSNVNQFVSDPLDNRCHLDTQGIEYALRTLDRYTVIFVSLVARDLRFVHPEAFG